MYRSLLVLSVFLALSQSSCDKPEFQLRGFANHTLETWQCVAHLAPRDISPSCAAMNNCWFNTTINYPEHSRSIQITNGGFC